MALALTLHFTKVRPAKSAPEPARAAAVVPAVRTNQVAELHKKLAQQNREVARLKSENKALLDGFSDAVAAATQEGAAAASSRAAGMEKMIVVQTRQQAELKLAALKSRLHLTDEQAEAVRELLGKFADLQTEMAFKMFGGKATKDEMRSLSMFDMDGQLKQILTPDQWTGYQQYKK